MVTRQFPSFGLATVQRTPCNPDTDSSTKATVSLMQQYIRAAAVHPAIVDATRQALTCVPAGAPAWRKADAIFAWVKRHQRFETDESILARSFGLGPDNELLIRPELFLRARRGDCDDFTMLTCSMLLAAGVEARMVTIAADGGDPHRFSHVYALAVLENGESIPMDTSHGLYLGWEAPRAFRKVEWAA